MNVNLELTDHCNLRCTMCSQSMRDEAHETPPTFMAFATWRRALAGLAGLPDVHLNPHWLGEPTLHPEFDLFVDYAFASNWGNRLFRHFKVHTNAVLLPEARAELLLRVAASPGQASDTFQAVHFSVDAFAPDTYARVKGKDRREQVYRNVRRFLALRPRRARPSVHVAFVVQEANRHEVGRFVAWWTERFAEVGVQPAVRSEWPSMDEDAIYLRRLNTANQAQSDAWHAEACAAVGLDASVRPAGSF